MSHRTSTVAPIALSLVFIAPVVALAQREPRVTVTAIAGRDAVAIDGANGSVSTGGAGVALRLTRYLSVQGELTTAAGDIQRSYEAVFFPISLPPRGATQEELERLGPVLRRDRGWKPGMGAAFALTAHSPASARIGIGASLGYASRQIDQTDSFTVVRLPEGWDPSRPTHAGSHRHSYRRGGPYLALAMPVNVTRHVTVIPEVRAMKEIGDTDYTTKTFGVRAGWRF